MEPIVTSLLLGSVLLSLVGLLIFCAKPKDEDEDETAPISKAKRKAKKASQGAGAVSVSVDPEPLLGGGASSSSSSSASGPYSSSAAAAVAAAGVGVEGGADSRRASSRGAGEIALTRPVPPTFTPLERWKVAGTGTKRTEALFCGCGGPTPLVVLLPCKCRILCFNCAQNTDICPACDARIADSIPSFLRK